MTPMSEDKRTEAPDKKKPTHKRADDKAPYEPQQLGRGQRAESL
jgi:hypothetical protein